MLTFSQLIAFALSFTISLGTSKGLGKHDFDIKESEEQPLYHLEYTFTILYNPALMATKNAILIFYIRVAKDTQVFLKITSYIILVIVNIAGVALTFLNGFQCTPANAAFTPWISGHCMSVLALYLCSAPVNVFTDLAILVVPIPVVTSIQLPRKQKIILVFTFALGIFATIVDVIRIYYLQKAIDTQRSLNLQEQIGRSSDFAWTASIALMWSVVEVNTGIICACIPTLRPLFRRIMPLLITDRLKTILSGSSNVDSRPRSSRNRAGNGEPAMAVHGTDTHPHPPDEGEVGMIDFVTTPGMDQEGLERRQASMDHQAEDNHVYFEFVDMSGPKSMLTMTGKEAFKYCTIVGTLFFLWGFSKGLLVSLINDIRALIETTIKKEIGMTASYSAGYVFGPWTVGQWVLRHHGFKKTLMVGVLIYGTGALIFWPSAVLVSYPGFVICQFVIGFGLSIIETAANPFIVLCGPPQYAEVRLLLAQAFQSSANVLSQVLSQKALYANLGRDTLINVQWTYLTITLVTVILALAFHYTPIPEAADAELQLLSEKLPIPTSQTMSSTRCPLIRITLWLAIFAQFCYIGCQESMVLWQGIVRRAALSEFSPILSITDYALISQAAFSIGRFFFAGLCLVVRPRFLLLATFLLGVVFSALIMKVYYGPASTVLTVMVFFFEGPMFPLIFAIGLRGMGKWTKWVAAVMLSTWGSAAIFPYVMYLIMFNLHKPAHYAFCVVVALLASATLFPAYLILVPKAGRQIDPTPKPKISSLARSMANGFRQDQTIQRLNRKFHSMTPKVFGGHKSKTESELPVVANGGIDEERHENLTTGESR